MNYIELGIWIITGIALGFSVLMGLVRGSRRATLRLVLVLICAIATFCLKNFLADILLNTTVTIDGAATTIQDYIVTALPEEMQELGATIVIPLVRVIVGVVIFLVLFWALKLISWIILYPICKLFVKKGEKKHAGFGALIGLVQGVVIALCFCVPLSGMVVQVNRVIPMVEQLGSSEAMSADDMGSGESSSDELIPEEVSQLLSGYEETVVGKFYGKACEPLFDFICGVKVEDEDGTSHNVTLSGQIDALDAMLKIVNEFSETTEVLEDIDFSDLGSLSDLRGVFEKLDGITADLPDEAKSTINAVVSAAIDMVPVPDDAEDSVKALIDSVKEVVKETDFTEIKFTQELDIIENLATTIEKGEEITVEDISATINSVSESALIVPILENIDVDLDLPNGTKIQLEEVFDELPEDTNQETVEVLRKLLGLTGDAE